MEPGTNPASLVRARRGRGKAAVRTATDRAPAPLVVLVLVVACTLVAPALSATRTSARGTVVVTIVTPTGVPANVTLQAKGTTRVVSKPRSGRSARSRLALPVGTVRLTSPSLTFNGSVYQATVSKPRFVLRPRATTQVRVVYKLLPVAGRLRATAVGRDQNLARVDRAEKFRSAPTANRWRAAGGLSRPRHQRGSEGRDSRQFGPEAGDDIQLRAVHPVARQMGWSGLDRGWHGH